ncbi:MAG: alpha/beta hydrolase [Planctomycetota bacterium]|mgnify:CR=1 FL=1|nr:MAG: alpha/beta hydrolase [Planctomycetota bacterium]
MRTVTAALLLLSLNSWAVAQETPKRQNRRAALPGLSDARAEVYKTVGDTKLKIYIFEPENLDKQDPRPAIVFFFGGGWRSGSPRQFGPHCKYLASRGMVAMAADYRVSSRHGVKAVDCVRDAKSAVRWIRANAERLGVDPNRIAAAGGSAGGHLAASTGTLPDFDEPNEDASISSRPNAMLLFNPAVILAPTDAVELDPERLVSRIERMGAEPQAMSPYHHIAADTPPTAIFHGTEDRTVAHDTVEAFAEAMQQAGNRCELHSYEEEGHGFFNFGRRGNKMFVATLTDADRFLKSLGYVEGEPTVEESVEKLGRK